MFGLKVARECAQGLEVPQPIDEKENLLTFEFVLAGGSLLPSKVLFYVEI